MAKLTITKGALRRLRELVGQNRFSFCVYEDCDQQPVSQGYCKGHFEDLVADGLLKPQPAAQQAGGERG